LWPRGAAQRQQQLPRHDHDLRLAADGDAAEETGAEDEVQGRGVPGTPGQHTKNYGKPTIFKRQIKYK